MRNQIWKKFLNPLLVLFIVTLSGYGDCDGCNRSRRPPGPSGPTSGSGGGGPQKPSPSEKPKQDQDTPNKPTPEPGDSTNDLGGLYERLTERIPSSVESLSDIMLWKEHYQHLKPFLEMNIANAGQTETAGIPDFERLEASLNMNRKLLLSVIKESVYCFRVGNLPAVLSGQLSAGEVKLVCGVAKDRLSARLVEGNEELARGKCYFHQEEGYIFDAEKTINLMHLGRGLYRITPNEKTSSLDFQKLTLTEERHFITCVPTASGWNWRAIEQVVQACASDSLTMFSSKYERTIVPFLESYFGNRFLSITPELLEKGQEAIKGIREAMNRFSYLYKVSLDPLAQAETFEHPIEGEVAYLGTLLDISQRAAYSWRMRVAKDKAYLIVASETESGLDQGIEIEGRLKLEGEPEAIGAEDDPHFLYKFHFESSEEALKGQKLTFKVLSLDGIFRFIATEEGEDTGFISYIFGKIFGPSSKAIK